MTLEGVCTFCQIIKGDEPAHVIYEDETSIAFLDREPATEGHTLVVPRAHARTLLDLESSTSDKLLTSAVNVARLLQRSMKPDGLTMLQTNEEAGWQSAFHVHLHLIPRWQGDGLVLPRKAERVSSESLSATRSRILANS